MICDLENCDAEIVSAIVTCRGGHRYLKKPDGTVMQLSDAFAPQEASTTLEVVGESKGKVTFPLPAQRAKLTPKYMPFGKHKGVLIEELPTDYLVWMAENLSDKPELQQEAENQLAMRSGKGVPRDPFSG